jgi:cytochrome oxidase assembly protein ShyY1
LAKIRLPWLIFTLLVFIALVKLGLWQSDRALEKEQRLVRIELLQQQKKVSLSSIIQLHKKSLTLPKNSSGNVNKKVAEEINDFPVSLDGVFLANAVFLLDNQVNKGQLGYRVLQVFLVDHYAVLVNLGWVLGSIDRNVLPDVIAITGQHKLLGHVRMVEKGILLMEQKFEKKQWPLRVQQIELDKFSTLIDRQLLPFVVYLDTNSNLGYKKNWQPIVMPPEKHRGYAFQWFSLALAWLLLMTWAAGIFQKTTDKQIIKINRKAVWKK